MKQGTFYIRCKRYCFEESEVMRMKFEKIYKETDGNYLHVLDRYDADTDSYPNNDYVQMRYKWFCVGGETQQKRVDELQARLDGAIKWVEDNKKSIPLSEWHGYTTEEYVDADDLLDILKIEQALEGGDK